MPVLTSDKNIDCRQGKQTATVAAGHFAHGRPVGAGGAPVGCGFCIKKISKNKLKDNKLP
jgi:hypothetical protein